MTSAPPFPGFDGLMSLSRREGVDIRPTLLRVLTDLYVQASTHNEEEARQFVELTSRLIDQVDDATRAAVRARLAIYPGTPAPVLRQLGLNPHHHDRPVPLAREIVFGSGGANASAPSSKLLIEASIDRASNLSIQPMDAAEISRMFFGASSSERALMLHKFSETPLKAAPRISVARTARAVEALEMAAFVADVENFTIELAETLILPWKISTQVVNDLGGEPLACASKALGMPSYVFQRVLLFLKPEIGTSVQTVYRLSRFYDILNERSALIMLAAWRGSTIAVTRARYRSALYDDERNRARQAATQTSSQPQVPATPAIPRSGSRGSGR
jgi:hypothetical protein